MNQEIQFYICQKCQHKWIPRKPNPVVCPRCKSHWWMGNKETQEDE